jgi:hypothetical protein
MLADGSQASGLNVFAFSHGYLTPRRRFGARTVSSTCFILSSKNPRSTSSYSRSSKESPKLKSRKSSRIKNASTSNNISVYSQREIVGDYGSLPLYHMLGYFSLIGLLRVHVLLGDFTLALKVVENVELNQKVSGSSRWEFCVLGLSTHFVRS